MTTAAYKTRTAQPQLCLVPGCGAATKIRGLCYNHYQSAARIIGQGKTTWADLEKHGKVRPALKKGPGSSTAVKWFLSNSPSESNNGEHR